MAMVMQHRQQSDSFIFAFPLFLVSLLASNGHALSANEPPSSATQIDHFDEMVRIKPISSTLSHVRFEFSIRAALSPAFRADMFDLFPKPFGKLLNAHPMLQGFQASLTQGRWKEDWGSPPHEFRPPGALLVAAVENETGLAEVDETWRFLVSALSGSLCASFEGMDADHNALAWIVPSDVPWAEGGGQMRFSTLPYEPVCTENLTPWFKLLPCGHHQGLASLISAIAVAESPLVSLGVNVAIDRNSDSIAILRTSLDVVLPISANQGGFRAFFSSATTSTPNECLVARSSNVLIFPLTDVTPDMFGDKLKKTREGDTLFFRSEEFAKIPNMRILLESPDPSKPLLPEIATAQGLAVMRDILSREGWSERMHGRYLLRFTNHESVGKRVRFMDQFPFFLSPLWHTFHATLEDASTGKKEAFQGLAAMQRVSAQFVPPSRHHDPTQFFLTVDVPPGVVVNVFLDVSKNFVQLREFSYACEKGFDVSSAAWFEIDLPQKGNSSGFVDSLFDTLFRYPWEPIYPASQWRLRFTQGLLVLVPMPDFSMPFNVIALSATAMTFFFGSIFRMTAAGHVPHWVLKSEAHAPKAWKGYAKRFVFLGAFAWLYWIAQKSPAQIDGWRPDIEAYVSSSIADQVIDFCKSARETGTKFGL